MSTSLPDHVTPMYRDLHWLRSPEGIDFKLSVLVCRCLHSLSPRYLSEYISVSRQLHRRRLRSSSSSQRTRLFTLSDNRAFPVASATVCLHDVTSAPTLTVFGELTFSRSFPSFLFSVSVVLYTVYTPCLAVLCTVEI